MNGKLSKIGATVEADRALDRMVQRVNENFTGGRVTKADLTSWIIDYFETHALESAIEKIQKDHFDQLTYLETIVREMKHARKNGSTEPNLPSLLASITSSLKGQRKKDREQSKI